ncbi:glutamate receptor ionotropic, kainate 2-like [Physella acuta]|uniref:glutamate receptor ionotropic, kainate 2-like n=1 Tax=Physella acuta TaxID=109671 RepID=UPI0027DB5A17|nr:glutamate receptor ionotropic, kainate 2-like [Physella acuta]
MDKCGLFLSCRNRSPVDLNVGRMEQVFSCVRVCVYSVVLCVLVSTARAVTTDSAGLVTPLTQYDSIPGLRPDNDEEVKLAYPDYDRLSTDRPDVAHVLGIIESPLNPLPNDTRHIMNKIGDDNISFTSVDLEQLDPDDVTSVKKALKSLRTIKPAALIGPYSWPYAVASEHARVPYFLTSMMPASQNVSSFHIQLFPNSTVFAQATEDMTRFYNFHSVAVFYDSPTGTSILERLAQKSWLLVTGVHVTNTTLPTLREQLKTLRGKFFTVFTAVLNPDHMRYLLDQVLSLSMFSPPNKWLLVNEGLQEYSLEKYVDSHANMTVLRLMMDYNSNFCSLESDYINLRRAVFHDAVRLYERMYSNRTRTNGTEKFNMRQTVRNLELDGCTGHLIFSRNGQRTESFLQMMTLDGYKSGLTSYDKHTGTWRSEPKDIKHRVEPSKSFSAVFQMSENVFGDDPLRISFIVETPFIGNRSNKSLDNGHPLYEGLLIDILLEMVNILGFKYTIKHVGDNKYGSYKNATGWTGMIRELIDNKADIALAPWQMTTERAEVVDFTKPFMTKGTTVVVKRPEQRVGKYQFLLPLSTIVWSAIFVAFVGTSLMLFAVSRVNSDRQAKYTHNLRESFWYIWGTLLRGSLSGSPHAISSRIISSAWWFFCLILSSIYTANLAAFLTITIGDVGINSAADLASQTEYVYGTVEGSQTAKFFQYTSMRHYAAMWAHMSTLTPNSMSRTTQIGIERVKKGKYAFIWDSPYIRNVISNECDLMEIGSPFDLKGYGLAYRKNAPFGEKLSMAILKMQDDGLLYKMERKWFRPQVCPSHQQSAKTQSLDLETVAGMYLVICGGAVMSMLLCFLQYCYGHFRRKRKLRATKGKNQEPLTTQELGSEFKRSNFASPLSESRDVNQDEITYANHSPLHYRTSADWT